MNIEILAIFFQKRNFFCIKTQKFSPKLNNILLETQFFRQFDYPSLPAKRRKNPALSRIHFKVNFTIKSSAKTLMIHHIPKFPCLKKIQYDELFSAE